MVQKSYYSILNLDKNCSQADIVRAYRVLAIKYHPDKNSDGKELFQELKEAYEVLADEEKRYLYDNGLDYDNTESRVKITPEDIENFCRVYKGSVEEEHDIIAYYKKQDGNILKIFDHIPLLEFCEEHFERLIKMIEKLFNEKLLENTREYEVSVSKLRMLLNKSKSKKKSKRKISSKVHIDSLKSLAETIKSRQKDSHRNIENIVSKYVKKSKK